MGPPGRSHRLTHAPDESRWAFGLVTAPPASFAPRGTLSRGQAERSTGRALLTRSSRPPRQVIIDYIDAYRARFAGRADLQGAGRARLPDRPEHLLRREGPRCLAG